MTQEKKARAALARVKRTAEQKTIQALQGLEFVKYEWRRIPECKEAEARKNPLLEVRTSKDPEIEPDEIPEMLESKARAKPKASPKATTTQKKEGERTDK